MNRFDRVTALLLSLQTRSVVTARFLADQFGVTKRTIYRDTRTLENAGVPIGAEAGVGTFLSAVIGYLRLAPLSMNRYHCYCAKNCGWQALMAIHCKTSNKP